jgi:Gpi18-like mannosyltransferase
MLVGLITVRLLPLNWRHLELLPGLPAFDMWAQWDAEHYVEVAVSGYSLPENAPSNTAFFPLYPLLIRAVLVVVGRVDEPTATLVGLVIANLALFGALIYLSALVARDFELSTARKSVLYVLVFPTTLFLSSVYAEPLFLLLAVATIYHARGGEWYRAGAFGLLAALTRPYGILLAIPIAIELWRQRAAVRMWLAAAGPPVGLAMYVGYVGWLFNNPLAYFEAGRAWGRGFYFPLEVALRYLQRPMQLFDWPFALIDFVSMILMVVLAVVAWRTLPASYAAYATAGVLFAMSSGYAWYSAARHSLALFPLILVLAVLGQRSRPFDYAWLTVSIFLALAFMARTAVGHWVT